MSSFQQTLGKIETLVEAERNQIENLALEDEERVNGTIEKK